MPKRQTTVDFSEIFYYAKEKHGIEWNSANNLFFRGCLEYKSTCNFYLLDGIDSEFLPGYSYEKKDKELKPIVMDFKFDHSKAGESYDNNYCVSSSLVILNQFAIEKKLPKEFLILCG
jgi:hypothetical protein